MKQLSDFQNRKHRFQTKQVIRKGRLWCWSKKLNKCSVGGTSNARKADDCYWMCLSSALYPCLAGVPIHLAGRWASRWPVRLSLAGVPLWPVCDPVCCLNLAELSQCASIWLVCLSLAGAPLLCRWLASFVAGESLFWPACLSLAGEPPFGLWSAFLLGLVCLPCWLVCVYLVVASLFGWCASLFEADAIYVSLYLVGATLLVGWRASSWTTCLLSVVGCCCLSIRLVCLSLARVWVHVAGVPLVGR